MKYATIIHTATSLDEVVEYINENLDEASEIAAQYALQATDEAARDWDRVDFAGVEGCIVAMLEFLAASGAVFNLRNHSSASNHWHSMRGGMGVPCQTSAYLK
jgi:hypothetical protein